jgi:hypothetical protein
VIYLLTLVLKTRNKPYTNTLATRNEKNAENNKKFRTKKSGTFVFFVNTQAKTKKKPFGKNK